MTAPAVPVPPERVQPSTDRGGQWVEMGGREYKIPPLSFAKIKAIGDDLSAIGQMKDGAMPTAEQFAAVAKVAHAAISRNYPQMKIEEVEEAIDFGNFPRVIDAVLSISAMKGKADSAGEPSGSPGGNSTA